MSQDTRKDKRAKVVSLNVRYKSATVDEFIENHSHDVSRGGIFVKTPTPFPPGTLLKFEIRLAGDKSVISGVGRVVWKREPTSAGPDKPAGMGVKFIKIDDASRAVIERLTQHEGAGSAYTSDPAGAADEIAVARPTTLRGIPSAPPAEAPAAPGPRPIVAPAPVAPSSGPKLPVPGGPTAATAGAVGPKMTATSKAAKQSTMIGVAPGAPPAATAKPATAPAPAPASAPAPAPAPPPAPKSEPKVEAPRPQMPSARKATMMGMGIPGASGAPPAASPTPPPAAAKPEPASPTPAPPATGATGPMFPSFEPEGNKDSVKEPTVMKQAAELLEEALKEAGGSLEEIGQNPLFLQKAEKEPLSVRDQSGDTVIMGSPAAPQPTPPLGTAPTSPALGGTPAPAPAIGGSQPPPAVAAATAQAAPPKRLSDEVEPKKKKSSGGLVVFLLLIVVGLAAGGLWAFQNGKLASFGLGPKPPPPPPTTTPSASASAPPSASASAAPVATTGDASTETATDASAASAGDASAAATATGDAGAGDAAAKDAGKAGAATTTTEAKPAPPPPPPPRPRPKPTATATATATDTSEAPPAPAPTPVPAPTPTAKPDDPF